MHTKIAFMIAATLFSLLPANGQEIGVAPVWTAGISKDSVTMMFAYPNSDDIRLTLTCDRKGGATSIEPPFSFETLKEGHAMTILISGPGGAVKIPAKTESNDMHGMVVRGEVSAARPVLTPFERHGALTVSKRPSVLTVSIGDAKERYPLDASSAAALATFREHCPTAN